MSNKRLLHNKASVTPTRKQGVQIDYGHGATSSHAPNVGTTKEYRRSLGNSKFEAPQETSKPIDVFLLASSSSLLRLA